MRLWILILVAAVGTYLIRASLILLLRGRTVPARLERSFRYVAPAVMAAIAIPGLVAPGGALAPLNLRVPAALVAGFVAWRWGSLLATLVAGLATYGVLRLLAG